MFINHEKLVKEIAEADLNATYQIVYRDDETVAAECHINTQNFSGRSVVELGEVFIPDLEGSDAKHPLTAAYRKAFDLAACRMLGYPIEEYGEQGTKKAASAQTKEKAEVKQTKTEEDICHGCNEDKPQEASDDILDETILMGRFAGTAVKNAMKAGGFDAFLNWIYDHPIDYPNKEWNEQRDRLIQLRQKLRNN